MSSKATNRPRSNQAPNSGNNTKGEKVAAPNAWSNPAPNAWSRPLKTRPPPGLAQPAATTLPAPNGATTPNPVLRERFLHLTLSLVGQRVTLTHTDGSVLEGIFHAATPFADLPPDKKNRFVLKAVQVIEGDQEKLVLGSTVVVPADKIVSIHCKSLRLGTSNGKGDAFRTDTEISSTQNDKSRDLVAAGSAWTAGGSAGKASRADVLLGDSPRKPTAALRGNIGEWDQFRANEELFNVQATFDENLYTTELDKSSIDRAKIKEAERLAREIETTVSSNIHIADERNQTVLGDYDEEDRYSGVLTEKLQTRNGDPAPPKKTMNYAAAAAKADAGKAAPSVLATGKKDDSKITEAIPQKEVADKGVAEQPKSAIAPEQATVDEPPNQDEKKSDEKRHAIPAVTEEETVEAIVPENDTSQKEEQVVKEKLEGTSAEDSGNADDSATKATTKLNANAKSFTFNPAAKTFTPSFVGPSPSVQAMTPIPQHMIDPITGAPIPPHIQGQQHYMHPMGHPAMIYMMNPQFAQLRYPGAYPGMEQPLPPGQMHPHPQHMQPQAQLQQDGQPHVPPGGDEHQQTGEAGSVIAQQQPLDPHGQPVQHPPHPGVPVPYPPNASPYHYGGGMPMQRGPGGQQMGGYHPHMGGGPQHMPVVPGNSFRHMYAMPQPPPQMRGPNGAPFYHNAPPHYAHYMVGDGDDYRGGGRGGRGAGRGRRGGRKGGGRVGPGRGYQSWNATSMQNGGRHTPQNTPAEDPTPAEQQAATADEPPPSE